MSDIKICYVDFWPGFDVNCNWFNLVFKDCFSKHNFTFSSTPENADIIIGSCFGNNIRKIDNNCKKIVYIGENERPIEYFKYYDYALSFDFDNYEGKNFRLPHWMLYINWWGEPNFPHARISVDQLTYQWSPEEVWNRKNFCAIIVGNPVQTRLRVAYILNEYKQVHGYGKVYGKHFEGDKLKLLENYRWNICFENSITNGYITEKFLEAKIAGCIPIYYGSTSVKHDFNEKCGLNFINFNDNPDELVDKIKYYEMKPYFISLASEPLFNTIPSLDDLYTFLQENIKL